MVERRASRDDEERRAPRRSEQSDSDKVVAKMTRSCRAEWFDYEADAHWAGDGQRKHAAEAFKYAWEKLADKLLDITEGP
jgi:hypothetical protein